MKILKRLRTFWRKMLPTIVRTEDEKMDEARLDALKISPDGNVTIGDPRYFENIPGLAERLGRTVELVEGRLL